MNTMVHFDQICPENGQICSHYGFHGLLSNTNRRKVAVALALIDDCAKDGGEEFFTEMQYVF